MRELVETLFEEKREDISIHISAHIKVDGKLVLEGIDSGKRVKELKSDWDYEYFLTIQKTDKEHLIKNLQAKNFNITSDAELLLWIKNNYSTNEAFSNFQAFLKTEGIPAEMFVWE